MAPDRQWRFSLCVRAHLPFYSTCSILIFPQTAANIGPSLGSPVGEWIADNSSMGLKWIFLINVIIGFAFAIIMCFIPETLPRLVIAREAAKSQAVDGQEAALLSSKLNILEEMRFVTSMTFKIMFTEPIVLLLGIYNGFAYGILFLYLDGVFDVFVVNNGLSYVFPSSSFPNPPQKQN